MRISRHCLAVSVLVMGLAQCDAAGQGARGAATLTDTGDEMPASTDAGELINLLRTEVGLAPMRSNRALQRAAAAHARDMEANDFMDHTGSDGRGVRARGRAQGYRACWIAENLASGQRTAQEVVAAWQMSPVHRRIMLKPRAEEYGLARSAANSWVLVVAEPGCR